jgi:acyl-CoA thioesterase I
MNMRFLVLLCWLAFRCVSPAFAGEHTIVVLGDSLSSGYGLAGAPSWVQLLADRLAAQGYEYEVVNASIAGDTSAGGLARLPRLLATQAPGIVVIELGGNDGLRGQPVPNLEHNLAQMIELAQGAGARVILAGIQIPPNYGPAYTDALRAIYPELAAEYGVPLVPFLMEGVALDGSLMQPDRIHPNAAGQSHMLENVWAVLIGLIDG